MSIVIGAAVLAGILAALLDQLTRPAPQPIPVRARDRRQGR